MFSFKSLFTPKSDELKEVQVVQLWYVKWRSIYHAVADHYHSTQRMEAFTSKEAAEEFATSLRKASILLKDSTRNVTVEKN